MRHRHGAMPRAMKARPHGPAPRAHGTLAHATNTPRRLGASNFAHTIDELPGGLDDWSAALGRPADTAIELRTLDRVFSHLVNPDVTGADAPRFAALERTLRQRLTYVQVFAVGTIQAHLYIVGRDRCGALVGLHTVSIET